MQKPTAYFATNDSLKDGKGYLNNFLVKMNLCDLNEYVMLEIFSYLDYHEVNVFMILYEFYPN